MFPPVRCVLPFAFACVLPIGAQLSTATRPAPSSSPGLLARYYTAGQVLRYQMQGTNGDWNYTLLATDTVHRDATGHFYEEIGWSDLQSSAPFTLTPASLALRQTVSLDDPAQYLRVPDLSRMQPALIGPITDLLTFYADRLLVLQHLNAGQTHTYVTHGLPNSWADGQHYLIAEDAVDFDLTLEGADDAAHTAHVLVRHVPPPERKIALVAPWIADPVVVGSQNNWVQVSREAKGYIAEVGSETFTVHMVIDTRDGKILSVHMENPVKAVKRVCQDAALTDCRAAAPESIRREVSLTLMP